MLTLFTLVGMYLLTALLTVRWNNALANTKAAPTTLATPTVYHLDLKQVGATTNGAIEGGAGIRKDKEPLIRRKDGPMLNQSHRNDKTESTPKMVAADTETITVTSGTTDARGIHSNCQELRLPKRWCEPP